MSGADCAQVLTAYSVVIAMCVNTDSSGTRHYQHERSDSLFARQVVLTEGVHDKHD